MLATSYIEPTLWEWTYHTQWAAGWSSFLWVPITFAAFWLGRRRIGVRFILTLLTAEGLALVLARHLYLRAQELVNSY
ncbi:MAG: hypothetical protein WD845_13305 [Pirellulales bacterium]